MPNDCVDCFSMAIYDMACPRCVARWLRMMIGAPGFDRRAFGEQLTIDKGQAFANAVRVAWADLRKGTDDAGQKDSALHG